MQIPPINVTICINYYCHYYHHHLETDHMDRRSSTNVTSSWFLHMFHVVAAGTSNPHGRESDKTRKRLMEYETQRGP